MMDAYIMKYATDIDASQGIEGNRCNSLHTNRYGNMQSYIDMDAYRYFRH